MNSSASAYGAAGDPQTSSLSGNARSRSEGIIRLLLEGWVETKRRPIQIGAGHDRA